MSTAPLLASQLKNTASQRRIVRKEIRAYLIQLDELIRTANAIGDRSTVVSITRQFGIQCMTPADVEREVIFGIVVDLEHRGFYPSIEFLETIIEITVAWLTPDEVDEIKMQVATIARLASRRCAPETTGVLRITQHGEMGDGPPRD